LLIVLTLYTTLVIVFTRFQINLNKSNNSQSTGHNLTKYDNSRVVLSKKYGLKNGKSMFISKGTERPGVAIMLWPRPPELLVRIPAGTSATLAENFRTFP
jgi:hypothetical protein